MRGLALMFPGQGSQAVGMGVDLSAAEPVMRETFEQASAALGYDLLQLCASGPAERLGRTDVTQPALLAVSVGIFRVLRSRGLRCGAVFGHSLGEYSALVAAGAVPFADALRIVRRRGEEMQAAAEARPGGMAALIGLDDAVAQELCEGVPGAWLANFNSPGQVVVSGELNALAELESRAKLVGARRFVSLPVSGAFHSPLMESAIEPLRNELEAAPWKAPETPFYSVCSLAFERQDFCALMLRQLVSPVRFTQAVNAMFAAGYDAFLEVGPGNVLCGLVRRIVSGASVLRVSDVETLMALQNDDRFLEAW